jgi:hypothetical protein
MDGSESVRERLLGAVLLHGDADAAIEALAEDLRGRAEEGDDAGIQAMVEYVRLVSIASDRALMENLRGLAARGVADVDATGESAEGRGIDAA